jgi:predicted phosphodiesterase
MIYAVISDIHANEAALKKVLEDAAAQGVQRIVCLGDVVGYGPLPAQTVSMLIESDATVIAGNHDDAVSGRMDENGFVDLARDAVLRHREALGEKEREFLSTLPYTAMFAEAAAAHGDFTDPANFLYLESEEDAKANFETIGARIAFVGHTHTPGIFLTGRSGNVYKIQPQDFTIEDDKRYIVNPGSVGYPREKDGQCLSSYVIYDSEERSVSFRFLPFAVSSVMQRGKNPMRLKKRILVAGAAVLSVAAASVAWLLAPKEEITVNEVNITEVVEDPELFVTEKVLEMSPEMQYLTPQLALDTKAGSAPVDMEIKYLDADDAEISSATSTIKAHTRKFTEIPREKRKTARKIVITLRKQKRGDNVVIKEFSPRLSTSN